MNKYLYIYKGVFRQIFCLLAMTIALCVCDNRSHRSNLDVYRFCHLQSGCDIASVILLDLDLLFQCQIFQMSISLKR